MAVSNRLSYAPMSSTTTYDFPAVDETKDGFTVPVLKTLHLRQFMISYGVTMIEDLRILAITCNLPGSGYFIILLDYRSMKVFKKISVGKPRVLNLLYIKEKDLLLLVAEDRVELRNLRSLKLETEMRWGSNTSSNIVSTYRCRDSKLYFYACGTYQGVRVIEPGRTYFSVLKRTGEYVFDSVHYVKDQDVLLAASKELGAIRMINPINGNVVLEMALFSNNLLIHIHDYDYINQLLIVSQGSQLSAWKKDPEVVNGRDSDCQSEDEECEWTLEASVEKTHPQIKNEYCRKAEVALLDAEKECFAYVNEEKVNIYNLTDNENDTVKFLNFSCTKLVWSSRWEQLFFWDTEGEGRIHMVTKGYLRNKVARSSSKEW